MDELESLDEKMKKQMLDFIEENFDGIILIYYLNVYRNFYSNIYLFFYFFRR